MLLAMIFPLHFLAGIFAGLLELTCICFWLGLISLIWLASV